ncbi:MAG: alpha/beta hydrolase, partial [bacterium]
MAESKSIGWKTYLAGAAVTASGLLLADQFLQWKYGTSESADELHYATTDDGIDIGLWRHRADRKDADPVLVVHGLGVNHRHMDLDGPCSVAKHLQSRGYDCWVVVLRGRGVSETPDQSWNFDDFAQRDLPAAIDYVLEETGRDELHWVGHSMGGMLYYAVAGA